VVLPVIVTFSNTAVSPASERLTTAAVISPRLLKTVFPATVELRMVKLLPCAL
jgi:hypothetical protein